MTKEDMPKLQNIMFKLFPSTRMFCETEWNFEQGAFTHFLDPELRMECQILDNGEVNVEVVKHASCDTVHECTLSGDWREVMDNIVSIAEQVGVQSVFYQ